MNANPSPPTDTLGRLGYRPALDGLRAFAVLLVMAAHFQVPYLVGGGHTGVGIFFALSGFLITRLLMEEIDRSAQVDLRGFYVRRARRLLPALVFLAAILVVLDAGRGQLGESVIQAGAALFYVSNWVQAAGMPMDGLVHTWSLSVEEQFYFVWPAVVILTVAMGRLRLALTVCVLVALAATLLRVARPDLHIGLDRADALMAGCALAITGWRPPRWMAAPAAVALGVSAILPFTNVDVRVWDLSVVAVASAILIGSTMNSGFLAWRPMVATGRISYGLYLWHVPIALILVPALAPMPWPVTVTLLTAASFGMAILSWRYVERPFTRRRGTRAAPEQDPPPMIVPALSRGGEPIG